MALFKFDQVSESNLPDNNTHAAVEKSDSHQLAVSGKGSIVIKELISSIKPGETIHYASAGAWSSHELLEHLLTITGPAKVYLTTWAMSENPVRTILNLIDKGLITELNCIFDLKVQDRAPKVFQLIKGISSRVRLVHCHAKVFVVENEHWGISNNGSANWTRNPRMEAGVLSADPKIAEFHKSWIMRLIEEQHESESGTA
jgi:hypothetical protein